MRTHHIGPSPSSSLFPTCTPTSRLLEGLQTHLPSILLILCTYWVGRLFYLCVPGFLFKTPGCFPILPTSPLLPSASLATLLFLCTFPTSTFTTLQIRSTSCKATSSYPPSQPYILT
ncbi:hypothetical protein F4859DRAFT_492650 [Xylaria cf. heliscus]|nr:hypothetical protein F4859DRAFT_492650 [Xylaria cf. heliscus]